MISRRGLLTGLVATLAAPAVITRPGVLMPLRGIVMPPPAGARLLVTGFNEYGKIVHWVCDPAEQWYRPAFSKFENCWRWGLFSQTLA